MIESLPIKEALQKRVKPLAVVGLGYVGLPLAVHFSRHFEVIGFDVSEERVNELAGGFDRTGEVDDVELVDSSAQFTCDPLMLSESPLIIVAVPTPIDGHRNPDLSPVIKATSTVGRHMSKGTVVVYESTVYPGVTEELCVPLLEKESGLVLGKDFSVGYSPERINPGDKVHTLASIVKIVSGSDKATLDLLAEVYGRVVRAGIHKAPSIRVAEAAKVIENTQRDLNIALMNELSIIFDRLGIDTLDVLKAAGTKWNFLPFRPGLVGGHCIGVDPYYLTYKAEEMGYHPQVILAGRRINDSMGKHLAETCIKMLIRQGRVVNNARVGILGLTFKENVPDLRNTRVVDVVAELREYGVDVLVHDPMADPLQARGAYQLELSLIEAMAGLDAVIVAVEHDFYKTLSGSQLRAMFADPARGVLMDVKGLFDPENMRDQGFAYWRL